MDVKISDYGKTNDKNFIEYTVFGLSESQICFLEEHLTEDTKTDNGVLKIMMYFDDRLYPFQSETAKVRMDDFISREEIEMIIFLSSFLEDIQ